MKTLPEYYVDYYLNFFTGARLKVLCSEGTRAEGGGRGERRGKRPQGEREKKNGK